MPLKGKKQGWWTWRERGTAALDEHRCTDKAIFIANRLHLKSTAVPKGEQISLWPRRPLLARKHYMSLYVGYQNIACF
jgi:hypothetical protein